MLLKVEKYILIPFIILLFGFMISDFKILCNAVGSISTVVILALVVNKCGNDTQEVKNTKYFIIFLLYYTITSLFNFDPKNWLVYLLVYLMYFVPFMILRYVETRGSYTLMKWITGIFFVIWTGFCLITIKENLEQPGLAREMAAYRPLFANAINGGGYPMGYGASILATYLFYLVINGKIKDKKLWFAAIAEIVIMAAMLAIINSFIIMLGFLVGCGVCVINRFAKSGGSKMASYFVVGVLSVLLYLMMADILLFLKNNTQDEFWRRRWAETYEAVVNGNDSHHIDDRQKMYDISKEGFADSPIIGVGYRRGNVFSAEEDSGVGNHSTFWDTLAQYGILGAIPLFLFLLYPYRRNKSLGYNSGYLVPFAFMAYLNPIFTCFHAMVVLYLIIPLLQLMNTIREQSNRTF